MKNKKAFTLAEALIAMLVIGVVGVLAIPTLKHGQEREYVTGAKKAYSVIYNATSIIETDHGPCENWNWETAQGWYTDIMNGVAATTSYDYYNMIMLKLGTIDNSWFKTPDDMYWNIDGRSVTVDINGPAAPNVVGADIHKFTINDDGVVPNGDCTQKTIDDGKMPWISDPSQSC